HAADGQRPPATVRARVLDTEVEHGRVAQARAAAGRLPVQLLRPYPEPQDLRAGHRAGHGPRLAPRADIAALARLIPPRRRVPAGAGPPPSPVQRLDRGARGGPG